MSTAFFRVQEHTCPGQHIREYPDATATNQNEVLHLSIKQYIPLDQAENPPSDALTVIGAHANGFPKVDLHDSTDFFCISPSVRNYMSHCGMKYTEDPKALALRSEVSG